VLFAVLETAGVPTVVMKTAVVRLVEKKERAAMADGMLAQVATVPASGLGTSDLPVAVYASQYMSRFLSWNSMA
jgi:hypothetical protein